MRRTAKVDSAEELAPRLIIPEQNRPPFPTDLLRDYCYAVIEGLERNFDGATSEEDLAIKGGWPSAQQIKDYMTTHKVEYHPQGKLVNIKGELV
mgnify:CR=1 FL=1